jgi:hypothetical protein
METVTEKDWTEGDVQAEAAVGSEPLAQATTALTCRAAVLSCCLVVKLKGPTHMF